MKKHLIAYIAGTIGVFFGLYGHYAASVAHTTIMLKNDTIHTQAAIIREKINTVIALESCTGVNSERINRLYADVDSLKIWRYSAAKK